MCDCDSISVRLPRLAVNGLVSIVVAKLSSMEGQSKFKTEEKMAKITMTPANHANILAEIERKARAAGLSFMVDWQCLTLNDEQKAASAAQQNQSIEHKMWFDGKAKNVAGEGGHITASFVDMARGVYSAEVEGFVMNVLDDKQKTKVRNSAGDPANLQLMFHAVKFFFVRKTREGRMEAEKKLREWSYKRGKTMGDNFEELRALFVEQEVMGGKSTEVELLEMLATSVPPRGLVSDKIRKIKDALQNVDEGAGELPTWAEATHKLESAEAAQKKEDKAQVEHEQLKEGEEEEGDGAGERAEANLAKEMRRPSVSRALREAYEQGQQSAMSAKHEETCVHCHKRGHTKKVCWALNPSLNPRASKQAGNEDQECYNWRDSKSCRFGDKCRWSKSHN
jgi:hypothetical protein